MITKRRKKNNKINVNFLPVIFFKTRKNILRWPISSHCLDFQSNLNKFGEMWKKIVIAFDRTEY